MPISNKNFNGNTYVSFSVDDGETSEAWVIHENLRNFITVGLYPEEGATGRFEFSISPPDAIEDGTAKWNEWGLGDVTEDVSEMIPGLVVALRLVSVSGAIKAEVLY